MLVGWKKKKTQISGLRYSPASRETVEKRNNNNNKRGFIFK